jgi:hypothetical protein
VVQFQKRHDLRCGVFPPLPVSRPAYFVTFSSEPAFYYDFADAALVMIDACNLAEGRDFITVKDFCTILVGKGYSLDR